VNDVALQQAAAQQSAFSAAQGNTLLRPVLGIDGLPDLKKRNFL
jgi:hypothetical protein